MDQSVATGDAVGRSAVIFYCERCGSRVPTADFQSGKARKTDETHAICGTCMAPAPKATPSATPPGTRRESQRTTVVPAKSSGTSLPAPRPAQVGTQVRPRSSGTQPKRPTGTFALIGIGAGVLVCVGLALLFVGGEKRQSAEAKGPTTKSPSNVVADVTPVVPPAGGGAGKEDSRPPVGPVDPKPKEPDGGYDPRASVAQSLLEGARKYLRDCPEDAAGYREKLQDITERYARTPAADEAAKLLASAPEPKLDPNLPPEESWSSAQDLLAAVDAQRDTVNGQWQRRGSVLVSTNAGHQKIELPGVVPQEYDLRIVFTRTESNECMTVNLPRGTRPATFVLGGWANQCIGFEMVKGRRACDLSESRRNTPSITNGRRYTLILQVRANIFRAYLDGRFVCACRAPDSDISTAGDQTFRIPARLGLGVFSSVYEFSEVKLLPVKANEVAVTTGGGDDGAMPNVVVVEPVPQGGDDAVPAPAEGLQPGLYATFGTCAKDKLTKVILSRPEFDLNWDAGKGQIDPAVPADHFGILYRGFLRVPKDGSYTFSIVYNEIMHLKIDGRPINLQGSGRETVVPLDLKAGDRPIRINYFELNGAHCMKMRWKLPGERDFRDIPRDALWHDPARIDQYKKH